MLASVIDPCRDGSVRSRSSLPDWPWADRFPAAFHRRPTRHELPALSYQRRLNSSSLKLRSQRFQWVAALQLEVIKRRWYHSSSTTQQAGRTAQGCRCYRCRDCGRRFNERTGTVLNHVQFPTDIVFLVVFFRLRYKLSLRELAEMFLIRGIVFTHEAVRDWEAKLAPLLAEGLRKRRRGTVGRCWHTDETYVKVAGKWCYLYRAIDRDGNLVDVYLSETRDLAAAKAFFRSARSVTQVEPEQVTTDGHTSYPTAIAEELGEDVEHRTSQYKNNVLDKITEGSKGATVRCAASRSSAPPSGSVGRSTRFATFCARPASSIKQSPSPAGGPIMFAVSPRCVT
jgi:putative transposase